MFTMPRRYQHIIIGASTAVAANILMQLRESEDQKIDPTEVLLAGFFGVLGGVLPDIIEPAINPNHRGFYHSYLTMGGVGYSVAGKHTEKWSRLSRSVIVSLGVGYISHLVADSTTPKGLPPF